MLAGVPQSAALKGRPLQFPSDLPLVQPSRDALKRAPTQTARTARGVWSAWTLLLRKSASGGLSERLKRYSVSQTFEAPDQ